MAIGVDYEGYRSILGVCEGHKEDKTGWSDILKHLKNRGLTGVQLIISDACIGLVESAAQYYPEADWQRCTVHFYRNLFSHVPNTKMKPVANMLTIHAQESKGRLRKKRKPSSHSYERRNLQQRQTLSNSLSKKR